MTLTVPQLLVFAHHPAVTKPLAINSSTDLEEAAQEAKESWFKDFKKNLIADIIAMCISRIETVQ